MRIACLTGCLPNYDSLGLYTISINKSEYCKRHGYAIEVVRSIRKRFQDPGTHAGGFSWSRLEHMRDMLEAGQYDWVWCVGCDTLVTNMQLGMESLIDGTTKDVLISGERVAPLQADSFLVKSSTKGIQWLNDLLGQYENYRYHPWVENQTMIDMKPKHESIIQIVPQWRLNSYDYSRFYHLGKQYRDGTDCYGNRGQWQPGDFLIHWPAATLEDRLGFLDYYSQQIVY